MPASDPPGSNWSGNYAYRARAVHHPDSLDQLRRLVATAENLHALGSRHSFNAVADAGELVALDRLPGGIEIDRDSKTVIVPARITYAELAEVLNRERLALPNMASLPHISVAGAVATATHGAGEKLRNLATSVAGLELVTSSGDVRTIAGDALHGTTVHLGALGIVIAVTLSVEPCYEVRQRVYDRLEWDALAEHFDDIYGLGNSVSVFHRCGETTEQVWVKQRLPGAPELPETLYGARPATEQRNPVPGADPVNATPQLDQPGPWSERLPHFRSGFTPSSGEEIQSEAFVPRHHAAAAIAAVRELADEIQPLLFVSELRAIAADELWLSPQYRRETLALHFTWRRREPEVERVVARIEAALEPFEVRSHWGKVTSLRADTAAVRYERLADFQALRAELDPRGAFVTPWLRQHVLGEGP